MPVKGLFDIPSVHHCVRPTALRRRTRIDRFKLTELQAFIFIASSFLAKLPISFLNPKFLDKTSF